MQTCSRCIFRLSFFSSSRGVSLPFLMQPRPRVLPSPFPLYPVSHCSFLPRSLWSLNLARDSSGGMSSCVAFWGCPQCLQEVVHSNLIFMVWAFLLDWKQAQKFSASSNLINNKYRPALLCALRKLEKPFLHLFYLPRCSLNPYFTLQVIIESEIQFTFELCVGADFTIRYLMPLDESCASLAN